MKPHIHAEVIKAWADGAEIEFRVDKFESWTTTKDPRWIDYAEYRIKNKAPVVRWKWVYKAGDFYFETDIFYSEEEASLKKDWKKLDYTRTEFPE